MDYACIHFLLSRRVNRIFQVKTKRMQGGEKQIIKFCHRCSHRYVTCQLKLNYILTKWQHESPGNQPLASNSLKFSEVTFSMKRRPKLAESCMNCSSPQQKKTGNTNAYAQKSAILLTYIEVPYEFNLKYNEILLESCIRRRYYWGNFCILKPNKTAKVKTRENLGRNNEQIRIHFLMLS